jgi:ABC-2 type transport system permease protein
MLGKVLPYAAVGAVQVVVVLLAAKGIFGVPFVGGLPLLLGDSHLCPGAGIARLHDLDTGPLADAGHATDLLFLPAVDPAFGVHVSLPRNANLGAITGEILPLTHFLRIVRSVMLKGAELSAIATEIWALVAFVLLFATMALFRFRRTLD